MKYGTLEPRGTGDAGVWSLIEYQPAGHWRILARGSKDELARLAGLLNEHDERSQPVNAPAPAPAPDDSVITVDEVESWNSEQRNHAWDHIEARTVGPLTSYVDADSGRQYTTNAAQLITGRAFVKPQPRRVSDRPQA